MNNTEYFNIKNIKGQYQKVISAETAKALKTFCSQELEFQQAVEQSGKSFQECLDEVVSDFEGSCSDLEAYSRAVKFYFSTASIHFNMIIDLSGDNGYEAPPITVNHTENTPEKPKQVSISLDDLIDF